MNLSCDLITWNILKLINVVNDRTVIMLVAGPSWSGLSFKNKARVPRSPTVVARSIKVLFYF